MVGTIRVGDTGISTDCGLRTATDVMKEEARRIGADGIYLARIQEHDLWSTCYRVTGRLLRYTPGFAEDTNGQTPAEPPAWATWRPTQMEVIWVRSHHRQPSTAPDLFDRTAAGAISLLTTDREGSGLPITASTSGQSGFPPSGARIASRYSMVSSGSRIGWVELLIPLCSIHWISPIHTDTRASSAA